MGKFKILKLPVLPERGVQTLDLNWRGPYSNERKGATCNRQRRSGVCQRSAKYSKSENRKRRRGSLLTFAALHSKSTPILEVQENPGMLKNEL